MFMFLNNLTKNIGILLMITSLLGCSKDDGLSLTDIVQTDDNGNVIGNSSSSQWNPLPLDSSSENEILVDNLNSYIQNVYNGNNNLTLQYNCELPDTLQVIAFPNPINNLDELKVKLVSSKNICLYTFSYEGLTGKYSGAGNATGEFMPNNQSTCLKSFNVDVSNQVNFPTDDLKIIFTIVTEDGCLYQAYGNVMVN